MDCRSCEHPDRNTGNCPVWGLSITQIQADANYTEIVKRCYSPLFKGAPVAPVPPTGPAPVPVFTPPPKPIWEQQQQQPAAPVSRGQDLRIPGMFEEMNGSPGKPKKKTRLSGKKAIAEVILNAVVWVTISAIVAMFFIVAIYSQVNPEIVIRQGDIPVALLAGLGFGTMISLVKGISIIRGFGNAS